MKLYVTKWVLARGILVLEATKPERRRKSLKYHSFLRGVGRRMSAVTLGRDAFQTLKEAQADARKRFEAYYQQTVSELAYASFAWDNVRQGLPIAVHKMPRSVSKCSAFI